MLERTGFLLLLPSYLLFLFLFSYISLFNLYSRAYASLTHIVLTHLMIDPNAFLTSDCGLKH